MVSDRRLLTRLTARGALRVPEITVYFWVIKALSTAMGESTSDYAVHVINPVIAVGLGFIAFVIALALQFSVRRYIAWTYWLAVVMVGVFGTMAADVLHVGLGIPYTDTTILYAVVLAAVFLIWGRTEKTLSIHTIDTPRRELFYWAAVVATFAMGTALGDLTATTLHLGYLASGFVFAGVIAVAAVGYWVLHWNSVFTFWFAYVATRPFGASFADYMGKPGSVGGLGWGDGPVALVLGLAIFCLVAYLAVTKRDVQSRNVARGPRHGGGGRPPALDHARPYQGVDHAPYPEAGRGRPYPHAGDGRSYPDVDQTRPYPARPVPDTAPPRPATDYRRQRPDLPVQEPRPDNRPWPDSQWPDR